MKNKVTRRQFLTGTLAVGAGLYSGELLRAEGSRRRLRSLTDRVKLGKIGVEASYLGLGTGTKGWNKRSNQTKLGVVAFDRMVRHAYERGINYFDAADLYGTHSYLRSALKGIPRDKYVIETKIWHRTGESAQKELERFLRELGTDYIDILLIHCVADAAWPDNLRELMDVLSKAKEKEVIRAHGLSIHSLAAMQAAAENPWVDVALCRINHAGAKMDATPSEVAPVLGKMHDAGKAVTGIKILGEGTIADAREQSLRYVLDLDCVDAILIGFESCEQVDDMLAEGKKALASD